MSKHRRRDRFHQGNNMRRPQGTMNNFPFGINPQQLLAMLGGNMDMGGLGNILSSMNRDGFDLNSMNQQMNNGNSGFNFNNFMGAMNNMNTNQGYGNNGMGNMSSNKMNNMDSGINDNNENLDNIHIHKKHKSKREKSDLDIENLSSIDVDLEDENLQMLKSLRNIVDQSKVGFVDRIINAYISGDIKDI